MRFLVCEVPLCNPVQDDRVTLHSTGAILHGVVFPELSSEKETTSKGAWIFTGQNLALTVLYVPYSRDSGMRAGTSQH